MIHYTTVQYDTVQYNTVQYPVEFREEVLTSESPKNNNNTIGNKSFTFPRNKYCNKVGHAHDGEVEKESEEPIIDKRTTRCS